VSGVSDVGGDQFECCGTVEKGRGRLDRGDRERSIGARWTAEITFSVRHLSP
jgi:hypothetical protein